MSQQKTVTIQIIGSLIACSGGVRDDWRKITKWLERNLKTVYGDQILVEYFDLFDDNSPGIPIGAKLPAVIINGEVLSVGEKISVPKIRKHLESYGILKVNS